VLDEQAIAEVGLDDARADERSRIGRNDPLAGQEVGEPWRSAELVPAGG
jgi:hypothetical protein